MRSTLLGRRSLLSVCSTLVALTGLASLALAQVNALSVDCTPFTSPNPGTSFGPDNTMGMSLQAVDLGGEFIVTEVTPAAFRAMTAAQLATFDLIAINNNPSRIDCGSGLGLGTTWHSVVGVHMGGRVVLCSHDAARFKIIIPPGMSFFGAGAPGPGVEPFGADELVRQAALWAGGGKGTGLLVFNDSARFFTVGGSGWNNPELNLPPAWSITDLDQTGGNPTDGGYTFILPAFVGHPIYQGLTDARFGVDSIGSFAANVADGSFHSIFRSYNPTIFTPTEMVVNSGRIDIGGFNQQFGIGAHVPPFGPDGSVITLVRDERMPHRCADHSVAVDIKPGSCPNDMDLQSTRFLPVAIVGTGDFDVTDVDPASVLLEGMAPLRWSLGDAATPFRPFMGKQGPFDCTVVGPDGRVDLILQFSRRSVLLALGPVNAGDVRVLRLTGSRRDGTEFVGEDVVLIL